MRRAASGNTLPHSDKHSLIYGHSDCGPLSYLDSFPDNNPERFNLTCGSGNGSRKQQVCI